MDISISASLCYKFLYSLSIDSYHFGSVSETSQSTDKSRA